ncbi:MAG: DMT family transporter [Candidatus Babeliales bacterium]|nr:DMT family transporter [Candidatus Babeliales bacterium]
MFLIFLLEFFFAASNILVKKVSSFGFPFFMVGMRLVIAGGILLIYQLITDRSAFKTLKNWRLIFFASLLNAYVTNAFGLWGFTYLPTGIASFIYNLSPFVTAILSYVIFKDKLTQRQTIGLIGGILGFLPALIFNGSFESNVSLGLFLVAFFAVFISMLAGSYGWITIKQLVYDEKIPLVLVNGITLFLGGIFSFINSAIVEKGVTLDMQMLMYVVALAIVSQVICYTFYSYLLKRYSTVFMSFASLISTAFTAVFAWFLFGEPITISFVISMIIVCTSLYVFYLDEVPKSVEG